MIPIIRKAIRIFTVVVMVFSAITLSLVFYYSTQIPSEFLVLKGSELELQNMSLLQGGNILKYEETSLASSNEGASETVELKLFGLIPVTTTHVKVVSSKRVTPGGTPFGIKLFTKGVIVIDINNIETVSGIQCPADAAGIKKGDVILTVDGREVSSNEEMADFIAKSNGEPLTLTVTRNQKTFKTVLKPALSIIDETYKGGLWVRDSSAGIGTITYYNEETGAFAGLGHGITDSDTGKIMPLSTGEVCNVRINSVVRGQSGTPGELQGTFISLKACGQLLLNNEAGIFGYIDEKPNNFESVDIKLKQEIKTGKATIICTLDESGPKEYEINIDKIDLNPQTMTKNMMLSVTDPALLEKTGGIVQGMSGSPILQDGKLVGAVTHVFINNPQKGYGIFAENMINFSNALAKVS